MALSFQQQSRRRKLIYFGLALLLFFATLLTRNYVSAKASEHDLQEVDLGQVDLGGSAARYMLLSLRGPLICGLWWETEERKKKEDWAGLDLLYKTLTKLQPHFKKPWEYRAWNISYNVSVEFDRIQDKYIHIADGINLLVEGEKLNRTKVHAKDPNDPRRKVEVGDPNLRWLIGFMLQSKMTISDEAKTYLPMLQLSCIHPDRRNPDTLRQNPELLAQFKEGYPRLIRRIRDLRHVAEGAELQLDNELLMFLDAYRRIPYHDPLQLEDPSLSAAGKAVAFPVWPDVKKPENPDVEGRQDPYDIAMQWYEYSHEPLPEPNPKGDLVTLERGDRLHRIPTGMSIFIFRSMPPRTKCLQAKDLGKEGWFEPMLVSREGGSQEAWQRGYELWKEFGRQNGIEFEPATMAELERNIELFRKEKPDWVDKIEKMPANVREEPVVKNALEAMQRLNNRDQNRSVANYEHWEVKSGTERQTPAIVARRHIYNAVSRLRPDLPLARAEFERGLEAWKKLLIQSKAGEPPWVHTRFGRDRQVQEEMIELQDDYMKLKARAEAPSIVAVGFDAWRVGQLLGSHVTAPGLPAAYRSALSLGHAPITALTIDRVEEMLTLQPAPLDPYLDQQARQQYSQRKMPRQDDQDQKKPDGQPSEQKPKEK